MRTGGPRGSGDKGAFAGKSADEIAAAAVEATRLAESVHITGTGQQQGQEMKLDFSVDNQDNCTGTVSGPQAEADVLQVGQRVYVRAEKEFWENLLKAQGAASEKAVDKLAGKWVKSAPKQAGTEGMCDKQAVLAALDSDKSERNE
ncbi:Lipoprotein [Streptomyces griseus]|uniref:Lipoprotein n=1 Tax=Streptomyces griseus TaxID=1911 RepID=A0A380P0B0_STRGR|nr:Lipoprotein [Streptomyces griseus]